MDRIDQLLKMTDKTVHDEFQQNNDNWAVVLDEKLAEFQTDSSKSKKNTIRKLFNISFVSTKSKPFSISKAPRRNSVRVSAGPVDNAVDEVSTQLWENRV